MLFLEAVFISKLCSVLMLSLCRAITDKVLKSDSLARALFYICNVKTTCLFWNGQKLKNLVLGGACLRKIFSKDVLFLIAD